MSRLPATRGFLTASLQSASRGMHAFTLVEMVTSCAILSLLMLALGYGLKLALLSTGHGATMSASTFEASDLVERVTDDLNEATNFTEKTSESVTFTVPDRGGDGNTDKIRYIWWPADGNFVIPGTSGTGETGGGGGGGLLGGLLGGETTGGTPDTTIPVPAYTFTRQVNDGPLSVVARNVRHFKLDYLYRTMNAPPTVATPSDRLLVENNTPLLGTLQDGLINDGQWYGQTFLPSSQTEIMGRSAFSITRVVLYLRSDGADYNGYLRLVIRTATAGNLPTHLTPLAISEFAEVSLSNTYRWVEFPFKTLTGLSPSTRYSLIIEGRAGGGGKWCSVGMTQGGAGVPPNTARVSSIDLGSTWTAATGNSLRYRIYGTTTP